MLSYEKITATQFYNCFCYFHYAHNYHKLFSRILFCPYWISKKLWVSFSQISKTLIINQQNIDASRADFEESCINKANAAQEFIDKYSINVHDTEEMRRLARIIQVDELHLFDQKGVMPDQSLNILVSVLTLAHKCNSFCPF